MAKRKAPTVRQGRRPASGRSTGSGAARGRPASILQRLIPTQLSESAAGFVRSERRALAWVAAAVAAGFGAVALAGVGPTGLAASWKQVLTGLFGWGAWPLILLVLTASGYHLARRLGLTLPAIGAGRVGGGFLLGGAVLAGLHALAGAADLDTGWLLAEAGAGGGYLGATVLGVLIQAVGIAGAGVILGLAALSGIALVLGLSPTELLAEAARRPTEAVGDWRPRLPSIGRRQASPRPSTPAPPAIFDPVEASEPTAAAAEALAVEPPGAVPSPAGSPDTPHWSLASVQAVLDHGAVARADDQFDRERGRVIEETLASFGAPAKVVEVNRGPAITQFGVEPDFTEGRGGRRTKVKVGKIAALADDLALALAAPSIRIQAPVPGKGFVGIEVPNTEIQVVALRDVMEAESFRKLGSRLRLGLGQDVSGRAVAADLRTMPHLLIAGTTGSGKSVCVNAIIACLLLQNTPDDLRLVMVDPKRVELTPYNGVPHLLAPVVVDLERVVGALQWVSREMNDRYDRFSKAGVRNVEEYNQRMEQAGQRRLPYLVLVIDELADLMMLAPDETERLITRLAQLARATGIHLVIATQRPSVDVVTGLIKANFPARIAFAVASSVDSRVVLDQPGAERLLGRGDMLFQAPDSGAPLRMQGAFVSDAELARLLEHWRQQAVEQGVVPPMQAPIASGVGVPMKQTAMWEEMDPEDSDADPLFDEAVEIVRRMRRASISLLQRRLRIGYTRSARLVDQLEEKGVIGPAQSGSQARQVLDYGDLNGHTD